MGDIIKEGPGPFHNEHARGTEGPMCPTCHHQRELHYGLPGAWGCRAIEPNGTICGCANLFPDKPEGRPGVTTEHKAGDAVNHPKHYNVHPSSIECIEVVRHHNFNVGNAIKYLWRQGLKEGEPSVKDLKKAIWYLTDEVARLEKEGDK